MLSVPSSPSSSLMRWSSLLLVLALASAQAVVAAEGDCGGEETLRCGATVAPACCGPASHSCLANALSPREECDCCHTDIVAWISARISVSEPREGTPTGHGLASGSASDAAGAKLSMHLGRGVIARRVVPSFCISFCRWQC